MIKYETIKLIQEEGIPLELLEFVECDSKKETQKKINRFKNCINNIIQLNESYLIKKAIVNKQYPKMYCFPGPIAIKKVLTIMNKSEKECI